MTEADKLRKTRSLILSHKSTFEDLCATNKAELDDLRAFLGRLLECSDRGKAMLGSADLQIEEVVVAAREADLSPDTRATVEKHMRAAIAHRSQIASTCMRVQQDIEDIRAQIATAESVLDKALEGVTAMAGMLQKVDAVAELCGIDL